MGGSAPGGALAAVAEVNHDEQDDYAHGRELQQPFRSLGADDERGHKGERQRRVTRRPEREVRPPPPAQREQKKKEGRQDRQKREGARRCLSRRPQPDLAHRDKRQKGRDKGDGPAFEGYGLRVEAVGLVPAGLADVVTPAGSAPGAAGLPSEFLVGVLFLSAEAVPQALPEGRSGGFALPALGRELVLRGVEVEVEAGELVGGVGQVQRLIMIAAAVRVGEDRVGLLKPGELLRATAGMVGVALLGQVTVSVSYLRLRGLARYPEHLIVVDLICHRFLILTQGGVRGPVRQRQLYLVPAPRILLCPGSLP